MEWTAPEFSGGALVESYNIYSKLADQSESDWVLVGSTDLNTLTFEHLLVDRADFDIQYRVTAVTAAGEGAASIRSTFTLASIPEVNEPVSLISQSKESLELQWSISSTGGSAVTGYLLYQTNVTTGGESLVYDGSRIATSSQALVTSVLPGHSYKYRVAALNRVGRSDFSPYSSVFVASGTPSRPEKPVFISSSQTELTLAFSKVEDNGGSAVTQYRLYFKEEAQDIWTLVSAYDGHSLEWTIDTGLETSKIYNFRVSAVNVIGESEPSNVMTAAVARRASQPAAP
jgi:hypothetical protein